MREIDKKQIKIIHALLSVTGMANDKDFKKELVGNYSNWRVDSTKGLHYDEAAALISDLQATVNSTRTPEELECNVKRRRILHHAHMMNWYKDNPTGTVDKNGNIANLSNYSGMPELDLKRVDDWCVKYGQFHKPLNDHTSTELSKIIVQFEKAAEHHLKTV